MRFATVPNKSILNYVRDPGFRVYACDSLTMETVAGVQRSAEGTTAARIVIPNITNEADKNDQFLMHGIVGDPWDELDSMSVESWLQKRADRQVDIMINSVGGFVFDGLSIANAVDAHPQPVRAIVTGIAASAAGVIWQGADERLIYDNASFMAHQAYTGVIGNADVLEDVASYLRKVDAQIVQMFANRTGKTKEELEDILTGKVDGTWYTGAEAKAEGFADELIASATKEDTAENKARAAKQLENQRQAQSIAIRQRQLQLMQNAK